MCNLSNSDQKECMGIAFHHAGNKDTFTCHIVTYILRKKNQCKNIPQNVYVTKLEAKYIIPNFGCKICPQGLTPLKLDAKYYPKFGCKICPQSVTPLKLDAKYASKFYVIEIGLKILCKICRQMKQMSRLQTMCPKVQK